MSHVSVEPMAFNLQEAAVASSLSARKLADAIRSGRLPSYRNGRRRLIFREDLERYLKGQDAGNAESR